MTRDYRLYVDDILEAIRKIEGYTHSISLDRFSQEEMMIDAVIRNFEIMGEAAKNIPENIRQKFPAVPWKEMAGMRDKLTHEYFGVKIDLVWDTIKQHLPPLKSATQKMLEKMDKEAA